MRKITYKITGVCPLLMHNVGSMLIKKPTGMSHEEFENSEEAFLAKAYLNSTKDKIEIPPRVWKGALRSSAKRSGLKQPGKRVNYDDLIKALLFCEPMHMQQSTKDLIRENAFVRIQKNKVLRTWPKLQEWNGEVSFITADEKKLSPEILDHLIEYCGKFIGLGDYRPEFGRFTCERIN